MKNYVEIYDKFISLVFLSLPFLIGRNNYHVALEQQKKSLCAGNYFLSDKHKKNHRHLLFYE